ncbi:MAG: flagellar basal body rod protein FlgB [Burkholderiales bacterium]
MLNQLTSSIDFQGQALTLRAQRQRLIASNIANADTPGYVSRDINFSQALRDATGGQKLRIGSVGRLETTQPGHIAGTGASPAAANLLYSNASQTSLDNNTVDMDRERASFVDNAVKYEATLTFVNGAVRGMLDAIKGGQA